MTANLLTLNSSKTEFLLIELRKQLDKIHNSSLNTIHSARNLGFIFDQHLTFSDQISAISKACYYHNSFIVSVLTLIPAQLAPLPPLSFTPNLITVIFSTTTYLSLRSSASNRSRPLLPVLLLKLLNAVTSHLSYTVHSLHWLKITERIEYKLLSLIYKVLTTTQPPYMLK